MRRKAAGLVLLLLACALIPPAAAEVREISIDYDGKWVSFSRYAFSLYVPSAWSVQNLGDDTHILGDAAGERQLSIEVRASGGYTLATAEAELSRAGGYTRLETALYGGFACLTYAHGDLLGAITLSEDGGTIVLFKFFPADEAMNLLFRQILSSLRPPEGP